MSSEAVRCSSGDTEPSEPAVELAELDCDSASSSHLVSAALAALLSSRAPCNWRTFSASHSTYKDLLLQDSMPIEEAQQSQP